MSTAPLGDWRILGLRGLAALAFGLAILLWPGPTVTVLVVLFGAFVLLDGIATLALVLSAPPGGSRRRRRVLILEGVAGLAVGAITIGWPAITGLALLYLIAAWAIVTGALEVRAAIRGRHGVGPDLLLGFVGVLSVAFGVLLVITPGQGALIITWLIGWYSVAFGVLLVFLAWRLRKAEEEADRRLRPSA